MGHRNGSSDREPENPTKKRPTAVFERKPLQLPDDDNCSADAENTSNDGSGKEAGLPCRVAEDGTDHGTEACKGPGGYEDGYGLQGIELPSKVAVSPNGPRLSCGRRAHRRKDMEPWGRFGREATQFFPPASAHQLQALVRPRASTPSSTAARPVASK